MKHQAVLFEDLTRPGGNPGRVLQSLLEAGAKDRRCASAQRASRPQAAVGLIPSSPVGPMLVCLSSRGIVMIQYLRNAADPVDAIARLRCGFDPVPDQSAAQPVREELDRFLAGDETALRSDVDLSLVKGSFQRHVLERLCEVGPGAILTYSSLAAWAGAPHASRAVGGAMHDNPIPVYVPCHRVVRSDLSLGGYGGGLDVKQKLLSVEGFSFTPAGLVAQDGLVWGDRSTQVFCRPGCRADRTNAMLFRDVTRASLAGMRACKHLL